MIAMAIAHEGKNYATWNTSERKIDLPQHTPAMIESVGSVIGRKFFLFCIINRAVHEHCAHLSKFIALEGFG